MSTRDDHPLGVAVVALGTSGSWTGAGRACSGYLVEIGVLDDGGASRVRLLFDAGNGSSVNLQRYARFDQIDAIFISHRHPDHWVDLISVFNALRLDPRLRRAPVPLYTPQDVPAVILRMLSSSAIERFGEIFDVRPVAAGDRVVVDAPPAAGPVPPVDVEVFEAVHSVPAVAFRVTAHGRTVAYSGDTADGDGLRACAQGVDLLLCEATWQGTGPPQSDAGHLTAAEAGAIARQAEVDQLVLTHIGSGLDVRVSVAEARATFGRAVVAADDLDRWVLPARQ